MILTDYELMKKYYKWIDGEPTEWAVTELAQVKEILGHFKARGTEIDFVQSERTKTNSPRGSSSRSSRRG